MVKEYRFSDAFGNGESVDAETKMGRGKSGSGCYVSVATGFVLAFLAIAIAVGVGIIVHFAQRDGKERQVTCTFPEGASLAEYLRSIMGYMSTSRAETPTAIPTTIPSTPTTAAGDTTRTLPATTSGPSHDLGYRLPKDLRPIHYDLELQPDIYGSDPSRFGFRGRVSILMEVESATSRIVINAFNLSIVQADVSVTGVTTPGNIQILALAQHDDVEMLAISLQQELVRGAQYRLNISFSGPLTNDLDGLYLSSYQRGNQTVYLATTQFESPDAREAFPCFDEPAFKANFSVTLLRKPPLISLSNSKVKQTENRPDGWVADVYETTPAMSTYLLAFIVCDFDYVSGRTNKSIEYRIYARRELKSSTEYALQTGMTILDYYGDVFGTNFPLKKQDMIAIPDFGSGAMENWGLITYRETNLLYDQGDTERQRQQVTLVIAHELAHQWFGDLVTLAWWDDLWLNEGFAEFVEYIGMDKIEPKWKIWEQFAIDVVQYVFEFDQIMSSHPLFSPAKTVEEMEQYFDSISYEKAASVIHMIRFCMGEDVFGQGLKNYLQQHKYGNANHTDLWRALGDALKTQTTRSGQQFDVGQVMDTWTLQMGFPVVKVTRNANNGLTATQKRFLINPESKDPGTFTSPYGYKWEIPLTMTSSVQPKFDISKNDVVWLHKEEETKSFNPDVTLPPPGNSDGWFLVNVQQYGYYRVNYDVSNWQALVAQLKKNHTVFPPVNRAQIIDDAWNLANAGETTMDVALSTLEYLEQEEDYVPWAAANRQLSALRARMISSPGYGALEKFIQMKVRGLFNKLGFDDANATALQSYTRTIAVSLACKSGLPECISGAVQLFKQWRQSPFNNPISPAVRETVYCVGVAEGGYDDWLFVRKRFKEEQSPNEKVSLRKALACSRRVWVLSTLLSMSIAKDDIRVGDATSVMAEVAGNELGTGLTWEFVVNNWDVIFKDFAQSNARMKKMLDSIAAPYHDQSMRRELVEFLESHKDLGRAEILVRQALEAVEFNIKWYSTSYPLLTNWLTSKDSGDYGAVPQAKNVRLPTNLRPLHYTITIEPNMYGHDPATFSFNGTMAMDFHCKETTDRIILHINELTVSNIQLYGSPGAPAVLPGEEVDTELQFLIIKLARNLTAGDNYTISMDFRGPLDNKTLDGLYLSSYKRNSTTVYLATTQFEPTDARKAFPCMDEPALKATFSITLIRRDFNKALSNMPVERSNDLGGGRIADRFQTTLPMSTYLVALIVCDFEKMTNQTKRNITYEVWARPEAVSQVEFALKYGVQIIDFYEEYFNVSFPLPKQSMIAIPDFTSGAMENWGLITYRETRILFQPGVSSAGDKEASAMTIAHELAHMWFGDLVSPQWWDELWLNEGFARFMQYLGTDQVHPEWREWDQFVVVNVHSSMRMDGLVSSHPVYVPVATPEQINEIFDLISYSKGAAIIRMIRHALGEETFKKGITNYLQELAYKNANHSHLWSALNKQAQLDGRNFSVGDVMDTWTKQMNYPVVTVTRQNNSLILTQQRYLQDTTAKELGVYTSPYNYSWDIPFTFTFESQGRRNSPSSEVFWFLHTEPRKIIPVPSLSQNDWVLGNIGEVGYYRVNYDNSNWEKLAKQLRNNHTVIEPANRAQIIDDAWNLANGGYLDLSVALNVTEYLDEEMDYVPWRAATQQLEYVGKMLANTEYYGAFKSFMANKTSNQYAVLGMNNTGAELLQSFLRSHIALYSCKYDSKGCVEDAVRLFKQWRNNSDLNPIQPELRGAVYCTAMRNGDESDWEFLFHRMLVETNANEVDRIQNQLACSGRQWVLRRLLNVALYSGLVRSQSSLTVVIQVMLNPEGTALAWDFIRQSWGDIFDRYRKDPFALKNLVDPMGSIFNTPLQLQELQDFVVGHPDLGTATRSFQGAVESVRSNVQWMARHKQEVTDWLSRQGFAMRFP